MFGLIKRRLEATAIGGLFNGPENNHGRSGACGSTCSVDDGRRSTSIQRRRRWPQLRIEFIDHQRTASRVRRAEAMGAGFRAPSPLIDKVDMSSSGPMAESPRTASCR